MAIRGALKYIPKDVMKELQNIKIEFNINKDSDCLKRMAQRSDMIRELRFGINMNIKRRK
jgi:hypothetical protein